MVPMLKDLFFKIYNSEPVVSALPVSGSARRYFRMVSRAVSVIGVINEDTKENKAFVAFTKHFGSNGINVPDIIAVSEDYTCYLQSDLGDTTLLDKIRQYDWDYSGELKEIYHSVIAHLVKIQIDGGKGLDYSLCIPRDSFDRQSIMWDLNYYKYCWLKLAHIPFDEQALENDFDKLTAMLTSTETDFFLFRDFQCRNIMLLGGEPYFIDYQGGRRGALQYDIASLLFDAIARIPDDVREELLDYYIDCAEKYMSIGRQEFKRIFYLYALVRLMQAMGAFGYRGLFEGKQHFKDSIVPGLANLSVIITNLREDIDIPEIFSTIDVAAEKF